MIHVCPRSLRETTFSNAKDAEALAKVRKGKLFSAFLCEKLCVLCVKMFVDNHRLSCGQCSVALPQHTAVSLWLTGRAVGFYEAAPLWRRSLRSFNNVETVSPRLTAMCCAEGASVHLLRLSGQPVLFVLTAVKQSGDTERIQTY